MSSRKPGYLIGVILLAIVFSFPQIAASIAIGWNSYSNRQMPLLLPGLQSTYYCNIISNLSFSGGSLIHLHHLEWNSAKHYEQKIATVNPETAEFEFLPAKLSHSGGVNHYQVWTCGDRLWIYSANTVFELVDGQLQPSNLRVHPVMSTDKRGFLLNGKLAVVMTAVWGIDVCTFENGKWNTQGSVVGSDQIGSLPAGQAVSIGSHPQVIECNGQHHLFWHWQGKLYHREGLDLVPSPAQNNPGLGNPLKINDDDAVSALAFVNRDPFADGWTVVRDNLAMPMTFGVATHAAMINGQPAAFIIDDAPLGTPVGHLYRLIDGAWKEHSSIALPFATTSTAAVASQDGQRTYLGTCTSQGGCSFYRIDEQGIHETQGSATVKCLGPAYASMGPQPTMILRSLLMMWGFTLGLGIVSGVGTWILMWWYTRPDYGFGVAHVLLASLLWRAVARLLDLSLVVGSSVVVGWFLTRELDWLALCDALNLRLKHSSIPFATMAAKIVVMWMAAVMCLLLAMQAAWGITPGKWICGLKTVRTSLRPCGIASVLAREIVFFVDAGNLLCWTPGILSVALTDCRQRLGDIVADTIVIETKSLRHCPSTTEGLT